ncbi:MAG: DDE-type integrase/transposase/recombinase, partial [Aeromonas sp.]
MVKRCEVCRINNRKKSGGSEFVETTRELEKVTLDLISLGGNNRYILVAIDYHTRFVLVEMIRSKNASKIVYIISKWGSGWKPEELITDNGKEFANELFRRYCTDEKILHRLVSVESHKSNGRIERLIRTIREGLAKKGCEINEENLREVIRKYNNSYHEGIGRTPMEAIKKGGLDLIVANSRYETYAKRF